MGELVQVPSQELYAAFVNGFAGLVQLASECPACILTAQRAYFRGLEPMEPVTFPKWSDDDHKAYETFKFREACARWLIDHPRVEEDQYAY